MIDWNLLRFLIIRDVGLNYQKWQSVLTAMPVSTDCHFQDSCGPEDLEVLTSLRPLDRVIHPPNKGGVMGEELAYCSKTTNCRLRSELGDGKSSGQRYQYHGLL